MKVLLRGFGRQALAGLLLLTAFTVILGAGYPAAVWVLSRINASAAEGSVLVDAAGCPAGSALIGVDQSVPPGQPDPYLHARVAGGADDPMAPGDPAVSGGSQLGPNSARLHGIVDARRAAIAAREGVPPDRVPADAVTGSASGLDPDISPEYAALQVPRLARTNGLPPARVRAIIADATAGRQLGFLGEPRVNVLRVNLALGHRVPDCAHGPSGRGGA